MKSYKSFKKELIQSVVATIQSKLSEIDKASARAVEEFSEKTLKRIIERFESELGSGAAESFVAGRRVEEVVSNMDATIDKKAAKKAKEEKKEDKKASKKEESKADSADEPVVEKRKPGRPPVAKPAMATDAPAVEKRKPGRPPVAKPAIAADAPVVEKRKPGRPPVAKPAMAADAPAVEKRKPGRPPVAKPMVEAKAQETIAAPAKKGIYISKADAAKLAAKAARGDVKAANKAAGNVGDGKKGPGRPPKDGIARQAYVPTGKGRGRPKKN